MEYRRLGRAGIKVSQLSFGSWVTFSNQLDQKSAMDTLAEAREYGVNFFDNAEAYANGKSEEFMGEALKKLGWPRLSYLVSTKFFWGLLNDPNGKNTLNRKYLLESVTGSLKRLQMDHVDLVYCHRPDPNTPLEETVWAMHDMIQRGYALYWGTSEWSADEIRAAWDLAEKHHLHKPVVEQPQYNLFHRGKVEKEYARLYEDVGLGLTTWSPLASGVLTGKYMGGIPEGSRATRDGLGWLAESAKDAAHNQALAKFVPIAKELDCTPAQLAIAWCSKNPRVSTVITGASRIEQLRENMKALEVLPKLTPQRMAQIDEIFPADGL
ncbi:MAG TPA: aldo/keto reductase [Pseudobdellovibrionaceae bacterium]|nr:aldo/keto reductase [Pseudobdellovibrionaceae bacterium]